LDCKDKGKQITHQKLLIKIPNNQIPNLPVGRQVPKLNHPFT